MKEEFCMTCNGTGFRGSVVECKKCKGVGKVKLYTQRELDKRVTEERESIYAELVQSEVMEKIERFFMKAPMDYDDRCNLWNEFLIKLLRIKVK